MTMIDEQTHYTISQDVADAKCARIGELVSLNDVGWRQRARIREIMAGGPRAVRALLGEKSAKAQSEIMAANLMLSAAEKIGEKLGRAPATKKDPPFSNDGEPAAKRAEKIERIVEWHDYETKMHLLLPQNGMWLPGYGFTPWIVRQGRSKTGGYPFPKVELRDPYESFPGAWGVDQQPRDIAFCRVVDRHALAAEYPQHRDKILGKDRSITRGRGGGVLLGRTGDTRATWSNQSGSGLEVWEYYDRSGCWWLVPELRLCLSYVPNLLSRPQFYVMKRFAFDRLAGQFDEMIGLVAGEARANRLMLIAMEDLVMTETNIYGDTAQGDAYEKGRDAVNYLAPGSKVDKPNNHISFEAFQIINNWERQARIAGSYPVTDDGISPMSFVTGRGMNELSGSNDMKVRQYHTVISDGLSEIDAIRLEWEEVHYPDMEKAMAGVRSGTPFAEKFTPKTHIKGDYVTRRVYGAMASFDDPTKIATGLQLVAGDAMDIRTLMENVDGLDVTKVWERVQTDKDRRLLNEAMSAMAAQGDQRVLAAMIGRMPDGDEKTMLTEIFLSAPEEQAPPEELAPPEIDDLEGLLGQLGAPPIAAQEVA